MVAIKRSTSRIKKRMKFVIPFLYMGWLENISASNQSRIHHVIDSTSYKMASNVDAPRTESFQTLKIELMMIKHPTFWGIIQHIMFINLILILYA